MASDTIGHMAREAGCFEYGVVLAGVAGCGAGVVSGLLVVPGVGGLPATDVIIGTMGKFVPEFKSGADEYLKDKVGNTDRFVRYDLARGAVALLGLIGIEGPTVLKSIMPHIGKFTEAIPDVIPLVLFAATLVYVSSAVWLSVNRNNK